MRTTSISYNNKKQVKRNPEDMVWVYHTHEPIVSQTLWDQCREMECSVSHGKNNKDGYVFPLSGLVYCSDCGNKMYIGYAGKRNKTENTPEKRRTFFNCGAFQTFDGRYCSSHYIPMKALNQAVLTDIRSRLQSLTINEDEVRAEYMRQNEKNCAKEVGTDKKELIQIKKRTAELDRLIAETYEDKVFGKISEEICYSLLKRYQDEKEIIKKTMTDLEKRIQSISHQKNNVDEFIQRLKAYMDVPVLTREMCMELIDFITVDKCPSRYSKKPRNIHIYYKLIDENTSHSVKQQWQDTNENNAAMCADN